MAGEIHWYNWIKAETGEEPKQGPYWCVDAHRYTLYVLTVSMHLHCLRASSPLWLGSFISRIIFQKQETATHSWEPPGKPHLQPDVLSSLQCAPCILTWYWLCHGLNSVSNPEHYWLFLKFILCLPPPKKNWRQVINIIYLIKFFDFKAVSQMQEVLRVYC